MHKHGFSAELLKTAAAILKGQEPIEEKMSSKEKMKKGLYNDNSNDQSDDGEGMDKVQPKALKKKFANRKDKDIDNDGDQDSSDEYIHNKRKAISKAMKEDTVDEAIDHDPKHVKQAIGIASDPRYKQGNMTGAVKAMNKISQGLHKHPQVAAVLRKQNESVDMHEAEASKSVMTHSANYDTGRGFGHIDKAYALHQKHKFKGVKFHYAMGDDEPHAVSIHKDSPAHQHPEFKKRVDKLPFKGKADHNDAKDVTATSFHNESVDMHEAGPVSNSVTTHAANYDTGRGFTHIDKAYDLHQKHKFKGVKFHYAMGDDEPHAVSIHKDSPAHQHPEFKKHVHKLPFKNKADHDDGHDVTATSFHKESVDLDDKNVSKALKHDCATHVVHEKWGNGQCIPGMHTLEQISEEEGIVTHYDVLFDHGIEESVSVKEMKIIKSMNHGHSRKKNK